MRKFRRVLAVSWASLRVIFGSFTNVVTENIQCIQIRNYWTQWRSDH
ncbi:hypothetical protein ACP8HD_01025 [Lactiplantibacillus plantarum]